MAVKQLLGIVGLTTPLNGAVVKVKLTRQFRFRLWLAYQVMRVAVAIAGGETRVEIED